MLFPSIRPSMFFRPEEHTFFSKGLDDVGIFQVTEIHVGDKDNRVTVRFRATAIHIAVDLQLHRTFAVGAFRVNPNDYLFLPQLPLHEGRRERVHRSSGIQPLPRFEDDSVRGFFHGHRVGPDDLPLLVPAKKGQVFLQLAQNI